MTHYLDQLAEFAAGIDFAKLPAPIREQTHWVFADTLAAIAAGSAEPEVRAFIKQSTAEPGFATVIGTKTTTALDRAALVNGAAGTFLEMDEGNRYSRGHPSVHVLPAVLAYAETYGSSGAELLAALVAGYEVGSRIGAASQLRGSMHPHGTWGTVGAAVGVARLAKVDAARMREIINIASSLTIASSKRTMLEGGLVRNFYAGLSNQMGLLALTLAECGVTGERDGLASVFGTVVSESFDTARVVAGLGTDWHIAQNYFKLHSCCRYNHGTLDALDRIAANGPLPAPEQINAIRVTSYSYAAELDDPAPKNTLAAKFSVPFAVATRIVHGTSAMSSFTWEALRNADVLALAQRVSVKEDPAMTARLPRERPAQVEIELTDGRRIHGEASTNRGDDADPYSRDELRGKFIDLGSRVWTLEQAERVLNDALTLERAPNVASLSAALRQGFRRAS
jgi:2-methylcitrate dehydratase PrpD